MPTASIVVLMVERRDDSRDMYVDYLRGCGFKVVTADTTDDGLNRARRADVVVTGIRVPGSFDGVELVRRLRDANATKTTPIVVLTACSFEPDQQRAEAVGCNLFLPKPCLPDRLVTEIRRLLVCRETPKQRDAGSPRTNHRNRRAS